MIRPTRISSFGNLYTGCENLQGNFLHFTYAIVCVYLTSRYSNVHHYLMTRPSEDGKLHDIRRRRYEFLVHWKSREIFTMSSAPRSLSPRTHTAWRILVSETEAEQHLTRLFTNHLVNIEFPKRVYVNDVMRSGRSYRLSTHPRAFQSFLLWRTQKQQTQQNTRLHESLEWKFFWFLIENFEEFAFEYHR